MKTPMPKQIKELNREQLLENLMNIIYWQGMTYAEVESAAGVYSGYISRMKSDPRKLPALDVLWKMAQVLGVSLEWLLEGTAGNPDETVIYLRRFLQRVFDLTVERKLVWKEYSLDRLSKLMINSHTESDLPFLVPMPDGSLRPFTGAYPELDSRFADAAFVTWIDDCHALSLVRLHSVEIDDPSHLETLENEWLELQMLDRSSGNRSMVACTNYGGDDRWWPDLDKLYRQLQEHSTDLRLDSSLRNMIDSFMNQWPEDR